mmetsp:Transcript_13446/g.35270  ORF Transcript_13446/g.35270 Transcript_13446/m.35270 type:complete len:116 (-) Transcript_13446:176-523(-)|eukprot:2005942-Prymnesium_polylepis.1
MDLTLDNTSTCHVKYMLDVLYRTSYNAQDHVCPGGTSPRSCCKAVVPADIPIPIPIQRQLLVRKLLARVQVTLSHAHTDTPGSIRLVETGTSRNTDEQRDVVSRGDEPSDAAHGP